MKEKMGKLFCFFSWHAWEEDPADKEPVKGTGFNFDPLSKGLISVFDMVKREYRFINLETLFGEFKSKGRIYQVEV